MKIRMKTTASDYNEKTGVSMVQLTTDIGDIKGYAYLHPEDKEIESRFAGCRYAEMRAGIKYMKAKEKIAKYKLKPLKEVFFELNQMKSFNPNSKEAKIIAKKIYLLEDEIETFKTNAKTLQERLNTAIKTRPEIIKNIKKKNQDNN